MEATKHQKVSVIVDTNFLLKQVNIRNLLPREKGVAFEDKYEVMTLNEVIKEVKDESVSTKSLILILISVQARQYITTGLPFELNLKSGINGEIDQKADFGWVENFARETGDIANLSHVDKLVIALGVQ